jgi:hypothetical protein
MPMAGTFKYVIAWLYKQNMFIFTPGWEVESLYSFKHRVLCGEERKPKYPTWVVKQPRVATCITWSISVCQFATRKVFLSNALLG